MPAPKSRRARLLLLVSAALAALLLLAAAEGLLRVAGRLATGEWPQTAAEEARRRALYVRGLYKLHPFLNTALREGAVVELGGKRAVISAAGYRSAERAQAKRPGVFRILCAGGSTTFDLLAARGEETWPWLLEEQLAGGTAGDVEVWNGGAPGWTSLESSISYLLRDQDLDPDLVIIYHGYNDLQPASHRPFDPQYVEGHAERVRSALGFGLGPPTLLDRSLLVERLRPGARADGARPAPPEHERISQAGVAVYARNVRSFIALVRDDSAEVVLVTHPIRIRSSSAAADIAYVEEWLGLRGEAAPREIERLNDVLRGLATLPGVHLYDAARRLPWEDGDFADPVHFSASGSGKMSGGLSSFLRDGGLVPAQR